MFFFRIWLSFFPSQIHLHPQTKTDMEPENSPLKRAKHWPKHQHFLGSIVRFFGGFTPRTWHPPVDGLNPANQLRLVVYPIIYEVYTSQVVQDFFHQPSHPHFAPFFNPQNLSRPHRTVEVFGYWSDYRWRPHVDRRWGIRSTGDVDDWLVATQIFVIFTPKIGGRFNILTHIFQRVWNHQLESKNAVELPSRKLTYPPKMAFWRGFSFSQGGIC